MATLPQTGPTLPSAYEFQARADQHPTEIKPLETLISQRDWATASLDYLKFRHHISPAEKKMACNKLREYHRQLSDVIEFLEANPNASAGVFLSEMGNAQLKQIKLNHYARIYEFPPYDLPFVSISQPVEMIAEVTSDSLAGVAWNGDLVMATLWESDQLPALNKLLLVCYRRDRKRKRRFVLGWFGGIENGVLTLTYQHPRLTAKASNQLIPAHWLVNIFWVDSISRDAE